MGLSRHGPDVVGDITKFNLGMPTNPHVDMVIHSAALLSFSQKKDKELHIVNTYGTFNVCNFCLNNHIPHLVYISTAYVCGDYRGMWKEEYFSKGQRFKNPYESSKYWAEAYIREVAHGFGGFHLPLKTTILRPSVIIGRSTDGKATAFEGFYGPVRAIARIMKLAEGGFHLPPREHAEKWLRLPKLRLPLTMRGDPHSTLNLVPVDWVAQKVVELMLTEGVFHLTHPRPLINQEVADLVSRGLGVRGPHFSLTDRLYLPHNRLYHLMTKDFAPYAEYEPVFSSSVNSDLTLTNSPRESILKSVSYWRGQERK